MSEFQQVIKKGAQEFAQKTWSGVKKFFLVILILAILGAGGYYWVSSWTFSQGTRAGTLIKISKKGVVFKTYEGQLNLGGFQSDAASGVVGNIWEFSVLEGDVYKQLQQYEGKQVKLHYKERYNSFPWQGDTNYFIYKVEQVQ